MKALLIAFAMMQPGPVVVPDGAPLTVAWASTAFSGSSKMRLAIEDFGVAQGKADLPGAPGTSAYFQLSSYADGRLSLLLNHNPANVELKLASAQQTPLILQFAAGPDASNIWGGDLAVTITSP